MNRKLGVSIWHLHKWKLFSFFRNNPELFCKERRKCIMDYFHFNTWTKQDDGLKSRLLSIRTMYRNLLQKTRRRMTIRMISLICFGPLLSSFNIYAALSGVNIRAEGISLFYRWCTNKNTSIDHRSPTSQTEARAALFIKSNSVAFIARPPAIKKALANLTCLV